MKRFLAIILAILTVAAAIGTSSCGKKDVAPPAEKSASDESGTSRQESSQSFYTVPGNVYLSEYGADRDYISLWDQFGKETTLADVKEDEKGLAYIVKDGTAYYLGLDFLSRAMVYLVDETLDETGRSDEYAAWYRYYIARRNDLLPEVPLYSERCCDIYNTKIGGVREHPVSTYRSVADALINWTSADGHIIIGSAAELTGAFRYPAWNTACAGDADTDIYALTSGLSTVIVDEQGRYRWNDAVVKTHDAILHNDGSKTFTIEIKEDLKYSDGSAVRAADYVAATLVFSSPVAKAACGIDHKAGMALVGYKEFAAYTGIGDESSSKFFSGIRILSDTTFSVTVAGDRLPYFYDLIYADFMPTPPVLWLGDCEVKDDGSGAYLSDAFYAKTDDVYNMKAHIIASANQTDDAIPYAGPYVIESYDPVAQTATLIKNPFFAGNHEGVRPAIDVVTYKKITSPTPTTELQAGTLDVIIGVNNSKETDRAQTIVQNSDGAFDCVTYNTGYGSLTFRCDFGPTRFKAVRQALAYCVDRATFAEAYAGVDSVANSPCCEDLWMYQIAVEAGMRQNPYAVSVEKAVALLESDGWIYNAEGGAYTDGVRYKKIAPEEMSEADKTFCSRNGRYATVQVGHDYYMPLVLNGYGVDGDPFSEQLFSFLTDNARMRAAGFAVQTRVGDRYAMLSEQKQKDTYGGIYGGIPCYNAFVGFTDFGDPRCDFSRTAAVDAAYDDCNVCFLKDEADIYLLR